MAKLGKKYGRLFKIRIHISFLAFLAFLCCPPSLHAEWSILSGAKTAPSYLGQSPKKSDVVFSVRTVRPEALKEIKAFEATRVEWGYSSASNKQFIASLHNIVPWVGGTLNSNLALSDEDGYSKDFDGKTLFHPRMKAWSGGGKWITTTHPKTREALRTQIKMYIDRAVSSIQIDDPLLQLYSALLWGGDFNPSTLDGFSSFLNAYPDKAELERLGLESLHGDYRQYLRSRYGIRNSDDYQRRYKILPSTGLWMKYIRQTVRDHYTEVRQFLDSASSKRISLSMNLGMLDRPDEKNWHFFLAEYADYVMSETPIANIDDLIMRVATIRALRIGYVPSIKPLGLAENQVAIATLYALGAQPVVPWDVYTGIDKTTGQAKRYFGTVKEYGDLYRFVRKHQTLFDNYELAAVVGIPIPVDKFNNEATLALTRLLTQRQIPYAFILVGETERKFNIDLSTANNFKVLVTVNPENDFDPENLRALHALSVKRVNASQLDDATLHELSPFVFAGESIALKLYPRAKMNGGKQSLQIHVVDEARGNKVADRSCRRRIGIKKGMLANRTVSSASWFTPDQVIRLKLDEDKRTFYFSIPECTLWGVLSLDLSS